jgi:6-phosphofructokinase
MRTLALLTNGGDTCSLNAAIKSIRDNARAAGYTRILAFRDGFLGIVQSDFQLLTWSPIDSEIGGTILGSQRFGPTRQKDKRQVLENLEELGVDTLVVIGGDGSLSATRDLYTYALEKNSSLQLLAFPRTIDNDIRTRTHDSKTEVALCPGFPSAVQKISLLTSALRTTTAMSSAKIFVLETMGRDSGWLAAACALGGAEIVLIPEVEMNGDDWQRFYDRAARLYKHQKHLIIGVSEGIKIDGEQVLDSAMGPRRLGGVGVHVAHGLSNALNKLIGRNKFGIRYQQAGYIPRMGSPSRFDVKLAQALGSFVGQLLKRRQFGSFPAIKSLVSAEELKDHVHAIALDDVEKSFFPVDQFYRKGEFCLTGQGIDFLSKIVDPSPVSVKAGISPVVWF